MDLHRAGCINGGCCREWFAYNFISLIEMRRSTDERHYFPNNYGEVIEWQRPSYNTFDKQTSGNFILVTVFTGQL